MYSDSSINPNHDNILNPLPDLTSSHLSATEMAAVTWPEMGGIHPFAPASQAKGYHQMFEELKDDLCKITGVLACHYNLGLSDFITSTHTILSPLYSLLVSCRL